MVCLNSAIAADTPLTTTTTTCPHPTPPLVQITKLNELGDKAMEAAKGGDVKLVFKGRAYKNAADVSDREPDGRTGRTAVCLPL